jgi:hypothetical protein
MAEALEGDQYPFSEAELTRKTGYSRQRLTQLRLGIKREIYPQEAVLTEGVDWRRYGMAVMYARHILGWLEEKKGKTRLDCSKKERLDYWRRGGEGYQPKKPYE